MIRKLLLGVALTFAVPAFAQTAPAPKVTYVQAGTLLDQPGKLPRGNSTIIVRDGRIVEIRDGFVAPECGAESVSTVVTRTVSALSIPNASAAMICKLECVPVRSTEPTETLSVPSDSNRHSAADGSVPPNQPPSATPTPSLGPASANSAR